MTSYTSIEARILRMKVLANDVQEGQRNFITKQEAHDLGELLEEMHRLHVAVSTQRTELAKLVGEPKNKGTNRPRTQEPAGRRPTAPGKTTRPA